LNFRLLHFIFLKNTQTYFTLFVISAC